jgi:N-acetylmuramoyl-L-alanine amidase
VSLRLALLALTLGARASAGPATVEVTTPRGTARLPVVMSQQAGPVLLAVPLLTALGASARGDEAWLEVQLAGQSFRFLLGAPLFAINDRVAPLVGQAFQAGDSLYLPLQFVAEILPRVLAERYRWDASVARLSEFSPPVPATRVVLPRRLPNGLLPGHVVTIDPGHGGEDPGNPGVFFSGGITEKNVTLELALLLRDELKRRGIGVIMTRTRDTLIALGDRPAYCTSQCDLFLSLHVNSLQRRQGYTATRGFEMWILGEENTEDAARVSRMENQALRFEGVDPETAGEDGLDFILRDLQMNEYLRESARAAQLIETHLDPVHPGGSRGVRQSNLLRVLNGARRPAVLVEIGYATNPQDARIISNRRSQQALAAGIADAVVDYLLEYERKSGTAPPATRGAGR